MTKLFSVDTSVFIAACRPSEAGHAASCEFIRLARQEGSVLIEPSILPVEIAAALAHGQEGAARAGEYAHVVLALPTLNLHALDGEIRVDGEEIGEAGWFDRGRLPPIPHPISISRWLIEEFLRPAAAP